MIEIKKRTEGKIKSCLTLRKMYKFYKKNYDNPVEYQVFAKVIKACNKELVHQVVNESEVVNLPYRLGKIQIGRFERSFTQPINKLSIDWKATRDNGFTVYHEEKNIYKWCWVKHSAIVRNKTGYKFSVCRFAKREVPKAVRNKVEYFKLK